MRAIVIRNKAVEFSDRYDSQPRAGEIPVSVTTAGICETDLQLVRGYMGFQGVPGHEFVGIARSGRFAGRRVVGEINCPCGNCEYCDRGLGNHCPQRSVIGILNHEGAFADILHIPESNLHAVPDTLSDDEAVFTEPLAAAFQIPRQVDLTDVAQSLVVGDGRLSYLVAQVLRLHMSRVVVVGKHPNKLQRFDDLGFATRMVGEKSNREFDLAVDCSGSPSGIPTALQFLRPGGTLVLKTTVVSSHELVLAPIVIDEITIVGSRCGPFATALNALANGEIDVQSLITSRYGLEQAELAFATAAERSQGKVLFNIA